MENLGTFFKGVHSTMIQIDFHTDSLYNSLALGRYFIHQEEIKRALTPILTEVYRIGYERGIADYINELGVNEVSKILTTTPVEEDVKEESNVVPEVSTAEPVSDGGFENSHTVLPELPVENTLGTEG